VRFQGFRGLEAACPPGSGAKVGTVGQSGQAWQTGGEAASRRGVRGGSLKHPPTMRAGVVHVRSDKVRQKGGRPGS
jgi:hypothetical protein